MLGHSNSKFIFHLFSIIYEDWGLAAAKRSAIVEA
jgi:hypothetical protein